MPINRAPSGGETMFTLPWSVWLSPATRARCCSGTIREVDACIAGHWKLFAIERTNITT